MGRMGRYALAGFLVLCAVQADVRGETLSMTITGPPQPVVSLEDLDLAQPYVDADAKLVSLVTPLLEEDPFAFVASATPLFSSEPFKLTIAELEPAAQAIDLSSEPVAIHLLAVGVPEPSSFVLGLFALAALALAWRLRRWQLASIV
ncbi:MAG: PEP-CTERM sorting domain-containing protein [Planctomycetota bacterium]|nr:MAG: PEP-CTERM sorting domain-containing protein [Planctomycetota bacterium]